MSDEFEGKELDTKKWTVGMAWWKGRQPSLFSDQNVTVSEGRLHLTMRKEKLPPEVEKLGYHDYTSAALHTKAQTTYGYFEVKAKPMDSGGSSSFWFQHGSGPGVVTEIDVFEIGGKAKDFERKYNMTLHSFNDTPAHFSVGDAWIAPWRLAADWHIYGLDWSEKEIRFFVDGVLVRSVENTHWHYPLYLTFDSETMPEWFGMPNDKDLPSTFSVEYVRAWKKEGMDDPKTANAETILTFPKIDRRPAASTVERRVSGILLDYSLGVEMLWLSQPLIDAEQVVLRVSEPELSENPPQGKLEKARDAKTLEHATVVQVRESNLAETTLAE
jgi:beta-glucanase (GH16 family)